jgi:hypothetical protein
VRVRTLVRLAIESVFIVLVLVVAGLAGLGTMGIIIAGLIAWILTAIAEGVIARSRQAPATFVPPVRPSSRAVTAVAARPPAPPFASGSSPPEAVAPEWLESAEVLGVHVAGFEPAPMKASPPPAVAPEAEPVVAVEERAVEPARAATEKTVVFAADSRQWNVWELERLARAAQSRSPARAEELGFLLGYLREFASPDGLLPPDFDALVRESFPELVSAAGA